METTELKPTGGCPHHAPKLRPGLPPLTERIARLPLDERGYPIPFFVATLNGAPDFRFADPEKLVACIKQKLCWVCGEPLGRWKVFGIGPMCAITRTSSEPPSHLTCMLWSVKGCPFLSRPGMVRREDETTEANKDNVAGIMIDRNPGVTAVWITAGYKVFRDPQGKPLFEVGEPDRVSWWSQGRPAMRAEVLASIESGLPRLVEACDGESTPKRREEALADLAKRREGINKLLPQI